MLASFLLDCMQIKMIFDFYRYSSFIWFLTSNMAQSCLLCPSTAVDDGEYVLVKSAGMKTLIESSLDREDGKDKDLQNVLEQMLVDSTQTLKVHRNCRKYYTEKKRRDAVKKKRAAEKPPEQVPSPQKRRSTTTEATPGFDIKRDCFYCGMNQDKMHQELKNTLRDVTVLKSLDSVQEKIHERNDSWGRQVQLRVSGYPDLIAPEAKYHRRCYQAFFFLHPDPCSTSENPAPKGRPIDEQFTALFAKLCAHIESEDECQYSMDELQNLMEGFNEDIEFSFTRKTLKSKLEQHYGDQLVISSAKGRHDIVCFKEFAHKILREQWEKNKQDPSTDKNILIDMAAAEISDEIRTMLVDNSSYHNFTEEDVHNTVPPLLLRLLQGILKSKSKDKNVVKRRIASISHSIISAARPRSFVSSLLLALTTYVHQVTGSRQLIDVLSSLGISESYGELHRLQAALASEGMPEYKTTGFTNFIFDNADFQIATLTGHGTFHSLGGLMVCTPAILSDPKKLKRSTVIPKANESRASCSLEVQSYSKPDKIGLSSLTVDPLDLKFAKFARFHSSVAKKAGMMDFLWLSSFGKELAPPVASWSGFMQVAVRADSFETSSIHTIPFIHATPSDMSTLYTALLFAENQCIKQNVPFAPVTFDCPLYFKSAEIIAASGNEFKHIIARLGGFHWLMSAKGAIGYIMGGSGLAELFSTVYAKGSVPHLMTGHAYTRSFRAHVLASSALMSHFIAESGLDLPHHAEAVAAVLTKTAEVEDLVNRQDVQQLVAAITDILTDKPEDTRMVKFWKGYLRMTHLLRLFLYAERTGDFHLHLCCMEEFLPIFHAAGHMNYAKATRLYLQEMKSLKDRIPEGAYNLYTKRGYYTIRRKNIFFAGNSSDLVIEQDLMRLFKTSGGLTRGRGITDNTISWFVDILPKYIPISQFLENFTGVHSGSSEQHKDLRPRHLAADIRDREKFLNWFKEHSPTSFDALDGLASLETGMVGDSNVNCDIAYELGCRASESVVGKDFTFSLQRKDKVVTLASSSSTIKVRGDDVVVDPGILFHRLSLLIKDNEERESFFSFELATEPTSLFKNNLMRKGNKAEMGKFLRENVKSSTDLPERALFVVDGGWLLRKLKWTPNHSTYDKLCQAYVEYVARKFGTRVVVVFDGYEDEALSTKAHEHRLRSSKVTSKEIQFELSTLVGTKQDNFLANEKNKTRLINFLKVHFESKGYQVKQARRDADSLITETALESAALMEYPVVIVGNDTDLQVSLTVLAETSYALYIMTEIEPAEVWKVSDMQNNFKNKTHRDLLLLTYFFTGGDSTSAPFKKGKATGLSVLSKLPESDLNQLLVFTRHNSTKKDLEKAGTLFALRLYGEKDLSNEEKSGKKRPRGGEVKEPETNIDKLRYKHYVKQIGNSKLSTTFNLESLPPTAAALKQHIFRVYHAVQQAMGREHAPLDWGWMQKNGILYPIMTEKAVAPDSLLELISCGCKAGCTKSCGCRKLNVHCSTMCKECHGRTCSNIPKEDDQCNEDDD
jgi:hypothetical protein